MSNVSNKPKGVTVGVVAAILANVIWGFSFLFLKRALEVTGGNQYLVLGCRFMIAFLVLLIIGLVKREKFSMRGKKKLGFIVLSFLEIVYFFFETLALKYSNSVFTGAILSLAPVFAILFASIFLKEIPTVGKVVFAVFPIIGVVLMSVAGKSLGNVTGLAIIFMLGACISNATIKTINRSASKEYSTYERTISIMAVCAVGFNLVALIQSKFDFTIYRVVLDFNFLGPVLFLAVVCSVTAQLLINFATGKLSVLHLTVFSALSTVVSTLAGIFILKEAVSWMTILGVLLAMFGILMVNILEAKKSTAAPSKNA